MISDLKNRKVYFTLLILFSIFMLFLTFFGDHGLLELNKLSNKKNNLLANIKEISDENSMLYIEIDRLKRDKTYIEELARKEYGLVKPGEIVFLFQD